MYMYIHANSVGICYSVHICTCTCIIIQVHVHVHVHVIIQVGEIHPPATQTATCTSHLFTALYTLLGLRLTHTFAACQPVNGF